MKIAYLALAHDHPQLLKRLIGSLSNEDAGFFIHIDKKSQLEDFSTVQGPNVFFTRQREIVHWGEYSMVEAILCLIREALEWSERADYLVLLSGSDYPLRSGKYIQSFLTENRGSEFLSMVRIPCDSVGKPLSRINTIRYPSDKPVRRFAGRVLAKFGLAQRDYRKSLGTLEPYSGSTWWALSREACGYMVDFAERNRKYAEFFRTTPAPDEMFFHTILANSSYKTKIRRNLHYVDWPPQGGPHPATMNENHVAFFESQKKIQLDDVYGSGEALFARKFSGERMDLLERVDRMIKRMEVA
jgi:hypothetical protein